MRKTIMVLFLCLFAAQTLMAQTKRTIRVYGQNVQALLYGNGEYELLDAVYRVSDSNTPKYTMERTFGELPNNTLDLSMPIYVDGNQYSLVKIGARVFANCTNFNTVKLPSTLREIGEYAFFRTQITSIHIPESCRVIGKRAFGHCDKLAFIMIPTSTSVYDDNICEKTTSIRHYAPEITTINEDKSTIVAKAEMSDTEDSVDDNVDVGIPTNKSLNSNTYAIIIANRKYKNASELRVAHHDGEIFKQYCEKTLGIPSEQIRMDLDATKNEMEDRFEWIKKMSEIDGNARFIIYYSGHGIPDDKTLSAYLLPADGNPERATSGISLKAMYKNLGSIKAERIVLFIDACFSGAQRNDDMSSNARAARVNTREETATGSLVVFSASKGSEKAYDYREKGHGMFSYFLFKKLKESRGDVTLGELATYLSKEVAKKAMCINDNAQTPTVSTSDATASVWKNWKLK